MDKLKSSCMICYKPLRRMLVCSKCRRKNFIDKHGNKLESKLEISSKGVYRWVVDMKDYGLVGCGTNLHREDGPAVEWPNDELKVWWYRGKIHRLDGPAIEYGKNFCGNLSAEYYINGKDYSYEEWKEKVKELKNGN